MQNLYFKIKRGCICHPFKIILYFGYNLFDSWKSGDNFLPLLVDHKNCTFTCSHSSVLMDRSGYKEINNIAIILGLIFQTNLSRKTFLI